MRNGLENIASAASIVALRAITVTSGFAFVQSIIQEKLDSRLAYAALISAAVFAVDEGINYFRENYNVVKRENNN